MSMLAAVKVGMSTISVAGDTGEEGPHARRDIQ